MIEFLEKVFAGEDVGEPSSEDRKAAEVLVASIGGAANIKRVWNCFTRLRFVVKDLSLVNEEMLRSVPSSGVIQYNKMVQVVYGMKVKLMRKVVEEYLASLPGDV